MGMVIDYLRVQAMVRAGGGRSYTIVWPAWQPSRRMVQLDVGVFIGRGCTSRTGRWFSLSTLIVLTAEQAELVRNGVLADPGFQPMPLSLTSHFDSSRENKRQARRSSAGRRAANRHQVEFLDRDVAAQYWKRQTVELALLISSDGTSGAELGSGWVLIALARASALGRKGAGATGVRHLEIRDWRLLDIPVPVAEIIGDLPSVEARWWRKNLHGPTKPLPPSTEDATLNALRSKIAGFDEIADTLRRPAAAAGGVDLTSRPSLQAARDANMTAVRVFSPDWRDMEPVEAADSQLSPELEQFYAAATENELIQDDIVAFEGWQQFRSQRGWVEFQSAGRRLLVKNINFTPVENATGADLVYWRSDPDAFVIVQYKVLTKDRLGFLHRINNQDRLPSQLKDMLACTRADDARPSTTEDFRLASTSAFVKFAYPMTRPHIDDDLIAGHYLPAEYVQLMYANPDKGQEGAKILRFPSKRSIDPETFARLVRDNWIGTSGNASVALHRFLPGLREHPPAHLVIAYDEPLSRQPATTAGAGSS